MFGKVLVLDNLVEKKEFMTMAQNDEEISGALARAFSHDSNECWVVRTAGGSVLWHSQAGDWILTIKTVRAI